MTKRSGAMKELGERHMEQHLRRPHFQSIHGLFRNKREVSEHSEEGEKEGRGHRSQRWGGSD